MDCLLQPPAAFAMSLLAQASSAAATGATETGISTNQWIAVAILVAVVAIPMFLGTVIAKALRMPDYSNRIAWILFALVTSAVVLVFGKLQQGVDLRGGTILVYEIDQKLGIKTGPDQPTTDGSGEQSKTDITSAQLIPSLQKRINPAGTQEIAIRPYGENQVEIIIPAIDQREVDRIKELISQAGILRFAILGNTRDHGRLIELARTQAEQSSQRERLSKTIFDVDGKSPLGFWALVDREEKPNKEDLLPLRVDVSRSIVRNPADGRLLEIPVQVFGTDGVAAWMKTQGIENIQVLMSVDPQLDVTGEDLAFAATGFDNDGSPCVRFKLTDSGSGRFLALTTNNAPDGQHLRFLGIVLDDKLLSAPSIRSPIQGDGQITGNFTTAEVEELVGILKAGQLPAALTKQPIAENQIDATLGADTISKGFLATIGSTIAVLLFMLYYYRFLGLIACIALVLNLLMTLAVMILISQPLTLPGIAGLVLTIGMSVDANVLIFERMREELVKGSAPRMAIRNGFSRATATITDSNLTALITAFVLYAIGTDQIRGFAVTMILGILFSMFTAIHMSRTILDIAERKGFLSVSMSDGVTKLRNLLVGKREIDFLGLGPMTISISLVLIAAGMVAVFARGATLFDIDFSGGSSVTLRLDQPASTDAVRLLTSKILATEEGTSIDFTVNNVSVKDVTPGTVFKIDSSLSSVDDLKERMSAGFAADGKMKLVTYSVEIKPAGEKQPTSLPAIDDQSWRQNDQDSQTQLVAFRMQATSEEPAASSDAIVKPSDANPGTSPAKSDVISRSILSLGIKGGGSKNAEMNAKTLLSSIEKAAVAAGVTLNSLGIELEPVGEGADLWSEESDLRFSQWEVGLPVEFGPADEVMGKLKEVLGTAPVWISSSSVGSRVANDMIGKAVFALIASLLAITAYIWFRFNRIHYGIAVVAALIHDVLITLGAIAASYWLADALGFMLVDQFKISMTVVAALLTIIGYSLNDTIVIFDRIRETKGKSLRLTREVVNNSINATLTRTFLTATTTTLVVIVLYFFGGEGIHAFAFSLVIGMIAGTYSTIFIASPILLWLTEKYQPEARRA